MVVVKAKVTAAVMDGKQCNETKSQDKLQLKRRIGLLEAVAITIGSIIGSGIFVSPKGVILQVGSVGASLAVWVACGFLSLAGALCYAELGTTYPGSGGTYLYLKLAFGPVPAFLFLWTTVAISVPCGAAILSLTFAKYVTQAFFPIGTQLPETALTLIAASTVFALCFVNVFYARGAVKAQNIFMAAKVSALLLIITAGIVYLCQGNVENYERPFENTRLNPGEVSLAFYSGFFSYAGWSSLNFLTEEIKEPTKNLPRALYISLPLVTVVYVMANVAYFAVLSPQEMMLSDAIAVTFGQKLFGAVSWVMSLFVAISTCGALAILIMTSSRLIFAGARDGNFPPFLSAIKISTLTPAPAIAFLGTLSLLYLATSDIFLLINYCTYVDTIANLGVVGGLLYMRYRDSKIDRPIKVCLIHPVIYLLTCLFTATLPILVAPLEVSVAILIALTGLPIYYLLIARKHPLWLSNLSGCVTRTCQKIFMAISQDE